MSLPTGDQAYLYKLKYHVYKADHQVNLALLSLDSAIFQMPERRELYFEKALYLHEIGRNIEACYYLGQSEEIIDRVIDYHYNPAAWDANFAYWKAEIYRLAERERSSVE